MIMVNFLEKTTITNSLKETQLTNNNNSNNISNNLALLYEQIVQIHILIKCDNYWLEIFSYVWMFGDG